MVIFSLNKRKTLQECKNNLHSYLRYILINLYRNFSRLQEITREILQQQRLNGFLSQLDTNEAVTFIGTLISCPVLLRINSLADNPNSLGIRGALCPGAIDSRIREVVLFRSLHLVWERFVSL